MTRSIGRPRHDVIETQRTNDQSPSFRNSRRSSVSSVTSFRIFVAMVDFFGHRRHPSLTFSVGTLTAGNRRRQQTSLVHPSIAADKDHFLCWYRTSGHIRNSGFPKFRIHQYRTCVSSKMNMFLLHSLYIEQNRFW